KLDTINAESARKTRTVVMMMGALMHDYEEFRIPYAGGCELGRRSIAPHLYALEEFGMSVVTTKGFYNATVDKKPGGRVVLFEAGDTVTSNSLFAAARTGAETILQFASANYAIQDVCLFLQKLGVKIDGIGTTVLRIRGVPFIKKNVT